nr:hypothetical protein [Halorubrum sp. SD690R]
MTDDDLNQLRRATVSYRDDVILQLGGFVGLRAFEIPQVKPTHVRQTDADHYRLRVPRGKDTTSSGGKPRNGYLPKDVERSLRRYQNTENIAPDHPSLTSPSGASRPPSSVQPRLPPSRKVVRTTIT